MKMDALIRDLMDAGVKLRVEHGKLLCHAPKGAMTAERQQLLRDHREAVIEFLRTVEQAAPATLVEHPVEDKPLPLSFSQEHLWLTTQVYGDNSAYNMPVAALIETPLPFVPLRRAVQAVVQRHGALRTAITDHNGEGMQIVRRSVRMPLPFIDLSRLDARELDPQSPESELRRLLKCEATTPFDLTQPPLLRMRVLRLAASAHVLAYTMHHMVSDGWSLQVFDQDLLRHAQHYAGNEAPLRLPPPLSFADHAAAQRARMQGQTLLDHQQYWQERCRDLPPTLGLPQRARRRRLLSTRGAVERFELDSASTAGLREWCRSTGSRLFPALLATFKVALARYAATNDIAIGTVSANRPDTRTQSAVGYFAATFLLRHWVGPQQVMADFVAEVASSAIQAQRFVDFPLERLEGGQPVGSLSHSKWFEVLFSMQVQPAAVQRAEADVGAGPARSLMAERIEAKCDLSVSARDDGHTLSFVAEYISDLYEPAFIRRLFDTYLQLLALLPSHFRTPIGELTRLADRERAVLLQHTVPRSVPTGEWIIPRLQHWASTQPEAPAVVSETHSLTYAQLDQRATALSRRLLGAGVMAGQPVVVSLPRQIDLVVAMVAVWRAGAVYVPLAPDYPQERAQRILSDAAPVLAIVDRVPDGPLQSLRLLDVQSTEFDTESSSVVPDGLQSGAPAYIIYTSGSTGKPKGVVIAHDALAAFIDSACSTYGFTKESRILQFATPNFDAAMEEIVGALWSGGAIVMPGVSLGSDLGELGRFSEHYQVSVWDLPTAYWQTWLSEALHHGWAIPPGVRTVIIGGERVDPQRVRDWQLLPEPRPVLFNSYGPTEATVVATACRIDLNPVTNQAPIGHALPHATAVVLDHAMQCLPVDVEGELYIGGAALALGYHGLPRQTAESFVPDPFSQVPGARLYRTGDRAIRRNDGELDYAGRADSQLKIRGFRVEPAEIEAQVRHDPAVIDCAVVPQMDEDGSAQLVAYVVFREPDQLHEGERPGGDEGQWRRLVGGAALGIALPVDGLEAAQTEMCFGSGAADMCALASNLGVSTATLYAVVFGQWLCALSQQPQVCIVVPCRMPDGVADGAYLLRVSAASTQGLAEAARVMVGDLAVARAAGPMSATQVLRLFDGSSDESSPAVVPALVTALEWQELGIAGGVCPPFSARVCLDLRDSARLRWAAGSVSPSAARHYADVHSHIVAQAVAKPDSPFGQLQWLPPRDAELVLEAWNRTDRPRLPFTDVASAVYDQARRSPDAVAIRHGGRTLSYAELVAQADRVAHALQRRGTRAGDVVGVCLPRDTDLVACLLGVLRLGAAYAPLDPTYPVERIAAMVEDGGVGFALTSERLRDRLPADLAAVDLQGLLDSCAADGGRGFDAAPIPPTAQSHLIYTSGSTGRPKAVAVTHGNTLVRLGWSLRAYSDSEMAVVLFSTSLNFDLSVFELWSPLVRGGSLLVVDNILSLIEDPGLQPVLINTVPSAVKALLAAEAIPAATRVFNIAGEPLAAEVVADLLDRPGVDRVCNLYGPSEDTTYSTCMAFEQAPDGEPSIGRPLDNTRCYVVDAQLRPVPVGVPGELLIGGLGLSLGYVGRGGLTAAKFVPDPFGATPGARLYRTGDLARFRHDGQLDFLGRIDHQVKVNGFRIELGEIDSCLRACAVCLDVLTTVLERPGGGKQLVSYLVVDDAARSAVDAVTQRVRVHCERHLPSYMVPSAFVLLDRFPLSLSGKVDRARLPQPSRTQPPSCFVAPRTALQRQMAGIWADVLGCETVGIHDDFFQLGGNSLQAARVVAQVRRRFGVSWPVSALFGMPTVAAAVDELRLSQAEQPVIVDIDARHATSSPLASSQHGFWLTERMGLAGAAYNVPLGVDVSGPTDFVTLRCALLSVVARQDSLRMRFLMAENGAGEYPELHVSPVQAPAMPLIDLSGLPEQERRAQSNRLYRQWARERIDLEKGPVLASLAILQGPAQLRLVFSTAHIVTDGWSLQVFLDDLWACYAGHRDGSPQCLPALPLNFCDFARYEAIAFDAARRHALVEHWREALTGAPQLLELPTDRIRPAERSHQGEAEYFSVTSVASAELDAFCSGRGLTQYMVALAAYALLLSRLSGQQEVVLCTPMANRHLPDVEQLIGGFSSTVALRVRIEPDATLNGFLSHIREVVLDAIDHQQAPYDAVISALGPDRHLGYEPLAQAMFSMEAPLRVDPGAAAPELRASEVLDVSVGISKFDLHMHLERQGDRLSGVLEYNTDILDRETARRWQRQYGDVLHALLTSPDVRMDRLALWSQVDLEAELSRHNRTSRPGLAESDLVSVFRAQVARTPDALAVECGPVRWSYAELDLHSDGVAAYLQSRGIGAEDRVGLSLPRDAWMLAALLGVLKAGACYVPLDPGYPQARLQAMVEDSKPRLVLCGDAPVAALAACADPVLAEQWRRGGGVVRPVAVLPQQLAYVIFTSGSTGRPKVVGITHANAVARLGWSAHAYSDAECARVLAGTSLNFDLSVYELWAPWSRGGAVLLVENVLALAEQPQLRPSLINSVPSAVKELVNGGWVPASVLAVNVAGEPLPMTLVNAVFARTSARRVSNLYGPSEDTTYSTGVDFYAPVAVEPGIGLPLDNGRAYVLDGQMQPVPVGVSGELYLGGPGVARGYLGDARLTAGRFVPDPFGGRGERLYRTGDRVRRRADGELDYLGRLDHQVKVRGFRIELGEVEACLRAQPQVRDVVAGVREWDGVQRLVAHVESDAQGAELEPSLLAACRARLPGYMVPSAIVVMERLPTSPNGKIDRGALPLPQLGADARYEAPRPGLETALAGIWSEVLRVERVGRHDDFFALGGHSLLAMRIVARVKSRLNCQINQLEVFKTPILARQAELLAVRVMFDDIERAPASSIPRLGLERARLSFGQQRLWLIEQLGGGGAVYAMPMVYRLRGDLDLSALRQALQMLIGRHQILRSRVAVVAGKPMQCADRHAVRSLPLLDLTGVDGSSLLPVLLRRFGARGFDLQNEPFFRAELVRIEADHHVLMLGMPHLASDAWSLGVLLAELATAYGSFHRTGEAPQLDPVLQYADYAEWQNEQLDSGALDESIGFWREALHEAPRYLPMPTTVPRPAVARHEGAVVRERLGAETMARVRRLAQRQGTTPSVVMATALMVALSRFARFPDILLGMPVSNRDHVDLEGVVGFFANTMVVRASVQPGMRLSEVLGRVREFNESAQAHAHVPFDKVIEVVEFQRHRQYSPLFQVLFNYLAGAGGDDTIALPGLEIEGLTGAGGQFAKFDLSFFVREEMDQAVCGFEYRTDLYSSEGATSLLATVMAVLQSVLDSPDVVVEQLQPVSLAGLDVRPPPPLTRKPHPWEAALLAELRAQMVEQLPDYMVPREVVALDRLPLNANGKIDRGALPLPQLGADARYEAPRPGLEAALAGIWSQVLRVERVGRHDGFFALGGHSLLAMQLVVRIRERLHAELALSELFAHPTLAAQAAVLAPRVGAALAWQVPVASGEARHPASFAQRRMWFIEQMGVADGTYAMPAALRLQGPLELGALRRALTGLVGRHAVLRTRLVESGGEVIQEELPVQAVPLPVLAVTADGAGAAAAQWLGWTRFSLEEGRLFRAALLRVSDDEHWLLMQMHHIVSDGWSMRVLWEALSRGYMQALAGDVQPSQPGQLQYGDYARWQQQWLEGERMAAQERYWSQALAGAPQVLQLPTDRARPPVQSHRGASVPFEVPDAVRGGLQRLCDTHGVTLFMALLAPFAQLLGRLSGQSEVLIGTPVTNRPHTELESLVGLFVNTLVLRLGPDGSDDVAAAMSQMRADTLAAYAHQDLPFERLVELLNPQRDPQYSPLFQVMYSLNQETAEAADAGGDASQLRIGPVPLPTETVAKFDLSLNLWQSRGRLSGALTYNRDLFDAATVERWVQHYLALLAQWTAEQAPAPARMSLLDEAGRQAMLSRFTPVPAAFDERSDLPRQFEWRAHAHPQHVAVVCGDEALSYAELNRRANRVAHRLIALGVGRDDRVGVFAERGPAQIVAVLATWKAGAAYLPLDVAHPDERLQYMLDDAAPAVVLVESALQPRLQALGVQAPAVAIGPAMEAGDDSDPVRLQADPQRLAYVIYTSGSTGRPKGVMIEQHSVLNLWADLERQVFAALPAQARIGLNASLTFDASVQSLSQLLSGRCLVLIPQHVRQDGAALVAYLRRHRVDAVDCTPAQLEWLLDEGLLEPGQARPQVVLVGGEAIAPATWQRLGAAEDCRFINVYGPTECTVDATLAVVEAGRSPHIGRPMANVRVYVVDAHGQPVPVGVVGELWIGGAGVGRGYLNQPGLTADRFLRDPFQPQGRVYRTGDLGRWCADGTIEYLGRNDHQVKLRGYRIELEEIQAWLAAHPQVQECQVLLREDVAGDRQLVAYVRCGADEAPSAASLREWAGQGLAEYMVPSAYVRVAAWPLTANGKLDRQALPPPALADHGQAGYVAPEPGLETALAGIWSQVLRVERVGRHDGFFALGGHSLLAMQLAVRIRERLHAELALSELFAHPTLAAQAAVLAPRVGAALAWQVPVASGEARHPASFAQRRMWFIEQMGVADGTYAMPAALRLQGPLELGALRRALTGLVGRHAVLRTRLVESGGEVIQEELPVQAVPLPVLAVTADGAGAAAAQWLGWTRFSLEEGRLFRAALLRVSDDEHWLLMQMHHIVSDGWSMRVLWEALSRGYMQALAGDVQPSQPGQLQYGDYARWQQQWLEGERMAAQERYWSQALAGAPQVLQLPTDRARPPVQSHRGASVPFEVPDAVRGGLQRLCDTHGVTLFMALLAPFAQLLGRLSGQSEVLIGTPVTNRPHTELESLVGLFVNTLVLRLGPDGSDDVAAAMSQMRADTLAAYAHQDLPFERLVELLNPQRDPQYSPLFQVMYSLNQETAEAADAGGDASQLRIGPVPLPTETVAKFDLSLNLWQSRGRLSGALTYNRDLFDAATVERWVQHYLALLAQWTAEQAPAPARMSLLDEAGRQAMLSRFTPVPAAFDERSDLPRQFEWRAHAHPQHVAVVCGDEALSYAELNRRANRVAHRLIALGVGRDDRVGVFAERGPAQIVAVLATWKAGAAYLPLDVAHPDERLQYMLDDAAPAVVLVESALQPRLQALGVQAPAVAIGPAMEAGDDSDPVRLQADPQRLAYVIYTSGSTGRPKGVMIEQHSVLNLWADLERQVFAALPAQARIGLNASLTFDASVQSLSQLLSGRCLVLIPQHVRQDGAALVAYLRRHRVDAVDCTPAQLEWLLDEGLLEPGQARPQVVLVGGEAIAPATWQRLGAAEDCRFINVYGPTECTVDATLAVVEAGRSPHIGRPMANVRVYVVDAHGQPVPVGVVGELWIGGAGVGRGYLNQPGLTADRFLRDPFQPQGRVYRTGDLGRWCADGTIEYLGRNDHQVKLRGYRIELEEIQAWLAAHPQVQECQVLLREDVAGDRQLVAYVRCGADEAPSAASLREWAGQGLAEYMVPSAYVRVAAWPLTANGKLDRQALPPPALADHGQAGYVAPEPGLETALAGIWSEVLGIEQVGRYDDFFALGGHSLLAMRLVRRLAGLPGCTLSLAELFQNPSLAKLAAHLSAPRRTGQLQTLRKSRNARAHLVLVHAIGGDASAYRLLATQLHDEVDVYAIESPLLHGDAGPASLHELALTYTNLVRHAGLAGPLVLAGWSLGGVIAAAMADHLGNACQGLVLVDSHATAQTIRQPRHLARRLLVRELGLDTLLQGAEGGSQDSMVHLLEIAHAQERLPPQVTVQDLEMQVDVLHRHLLLLQDHTPAPVRIPMLYVAAGAGRMMGGFVADGAVRHTAVAGSDHYGLLREPAVRQVSESMNAFVIDVLKL